MTCASAIQSEAAACAATLTFDAAQAILAAQAHVLGVERVPLAKAGRRVLAEPVRARIDAPRHDTAAMDGFAVRECDLEMQRFRIVGASYPAQPWPGVLGPGEAVRIMTGAAMPEQGSRVLVREIVETAGEWAERTAAPGEKRHVRARASDIAAGDIVLSAGRMLDPRALLVAAAADAGMVQAYRRPRVRIIASGDELVAPGAAAATRERLPDSLSQALLLMVRQWGGIPMDATLASDDPGAIRSAAEAALGNCDILVMTGGASRGDRDFAKLGLVPLGLELAFATVAIKPGKPVWYGRIGGCHVLGLPGSPTAALTVARLFLVPLLTALGGRGFAAGLRWTRAPLLAPAPDAGPRESFLCAEASDDGVRIIERQSASAQLMLATANALVRRAAEAPALETGARIDVLAF